MNGKLANLAQKGSARQYTLDGLRMLDCDNGRLRFLLNVDRALDMPQLYRRGENVSFVCKNGFSSRAQPFARRFEGGMLYTCGLDSLGVRAGYEQHGSLHNTPARLITVDCSERGITVVAETAVTALFGERLTLRRTVTTAIDADTLAIADTLRNDGFRAQPYCLLYHVNLGYPMLDAGGRILADNARAEAVSSPDERLQNWRAITEPTAQTELCCYLQNTGGCVGYAAPNGKRFYLEYTQNTLPQFVVWKSMVAGDYALGLEPATTRFNEQFAYATLEPGEQAVFGLRMKFEEDSP